MKLLVIVSTLDLSKPFGATPWLWQLFKAFYEQGHQLLIIPYHGKKIETMWWQVYNNPNYLKGLILEYLLRIPKSKNTKNSSFFTTIAKLIALPKLIGLVTNILSAHRNIDATLLIGLPLNQIDGLAKAIKKIINMPVVVYDLDVPTSLPSHGGFTFNYYPGSNLQEYDLFIIPSEESVQELKQLGANCVEVVHFGVDPSLYLPISVQKDIDVFFFGNGGSARRNNLQMMIATPSRSLPLNFVVSGRKLDVDLGKASIIPPLTFSEWRLFSSRSKINLNVVRELHARIKSTSTSRPFELSAMGCCVISAPYDGLERWFEIGKEMLIANSSTECIDLYKNLVDDEETRNRMGLRARERIKRDHTSQHRAIQIIESIKKV